MANRTVSTWGQMARDYSSQRSASPAFLADLPVVLKMLGDVPRKTALDVGCGGGHYSFELHELGAFVVGMDQSKEMIQLAKDEQERRGITKGLYFAPMDLAGFGIMASRTVSPPSYDIILCAHLLNHLDDLPRAAKILGSVSKPGTVLVVTVPHPFNTANASEPGVHTVDDYFTARLVQRTWVLNGNKYTHEYYHRSLTEYTNFFRDAGHDIVEVAEPRPGSEIRPRNAFDKVNLAKRQKLPSTIAIKGIKRN